VDNEARSPKKKKSDKIAEQVRRHWAGQPVLLVPEAVADILVVSKATAYRLMSSKIIPAIRVCGGKRKATWRVRGQSLDRWMNARERESVNHPRRHP